MRFLSALGGILCGALAAVVGGVILDYAQRLNWIVPTGEAWLLLPIVTGLAGLLGALVAVTMYSRYMRGSAPVAKGSTTKVSTPKGLEHVPGMPTFDVEAIRKANSAGMGTPSAPARPPEQKQ